VGRGGRLRRHACKPERETGTSAALGNDNRISRDRRLRGRPVGEKFEDAMVYDRGRGVLSVEE